MTHRCCVPGRSAEIQSQTFIHIVQSCNQGSTAVVMMTQHVLKILKTEYPEITRAYFRQDNASCYQCTNTVLVCQIIKPSTGIKVE